MAKKFSELGIKLSESFKGFEGKKISIGKILNKVITIHDYKITKSKYPDEGNGKCLHMQIEYEGEKRVIFTGSVPLQDMIIQVNKEDLSIDATIEKDDYNRYQFV